MGRNENATITMSILGADESRVDVDKVRKAVEEFGAEGVKIAGPVTNSLNNIQKGWDRIADKIADGKVVSQSNISIMVQQYAFLESAINQAFGSASKAPLELQEALQKAGTQVRAASTQMGQMNDALAGNRANTQAAAGNWAGLGNAIEGAGGKIGAAAGKFGLFSAALREGWQIGQGLNKTFGTDMSEWEKTVERFGMKAKLVLQAISDNIINSAQVVGAVLTGDIGNINAALKTAAEDGKASFKTMSDAVTLYGAEWDKLHPSIKRAEEAKKAAAAAAKEAADASEQLAKQQAALREKIDETTDALAKNIAAEKEMKGLALDAEHGAINRAGDLAVYARQVESTTAQIAAQSAEVAKLAAQHGASDPATNAARERLVGLESSLKHANERYREAEVEVKKYQDQQKSAENQLARTREAIEKDTAKRAEQTAELTKSATASGHVATATQAVATATTNVATAASAAAPKLEILRDEQGRFVIKTVEASDASKKVATEIEAVGVVAQKTGALLSAIGTTDVAAATAEIKAMGGALEVSFGSASKLLAELEKIAELGGSAEGSTPSGAAAGVGGKVSL